MDVMMAKTNGKTITD